MCSYADLPCLWQAIIFFYTFIYAHSLVVAVMCMYVFILPYYAGALTIFRNFIFIFIVNAIFRACFVHVIWCDQNFVCFHCKFLLLLFLLLFLIIVIQISFPQVHLLRILFQSHSHRQCAFFLPFLEKCIEPLTMIIEISFVLFFINCMLFISFHAGFCFIYFQTVFHPVRNFSVLCHFYYCRFYLLFM